MTLTLSKWRFCSWITFFVKISIDINTSRHISSIAMLWFLVVIVYEFGHRITVPCCWMKNKDFIPRSVLKVFEDLILDWQQNFEWDPFDLFGIEFIPLFILSGWCRHSICDKLTKIFALSDKSSYFFLFISLGAATSSFVRTFKGEKMDYDKHLLSRISNVTSDDAMHALVTHLVPIFDPQSILAVTCPAGKLDAVHEYFMKRGWTNLRKVPEECLFSSFIVEPQPETKLPDKIPGMSMFLPGAFASQFRCSCPKCDR